MSDRVGILYGVGVGTSDPELITVKGLKALQNAPVVAFPAGLQGRKGMAETIVAGYVRSHQRQLPLDFPYVLDEEVLSDAWTVAAESVWQCLQQGQDVVFVSEGDVSFYSTFTYLAERVRSQHPEVKIETIPGICSPLAAAAALGIPLTIRSQKLAILPALYNVAELETALSWAEVVVLMKVSSVYSEVWQVLEKHQLLEQSYIVERATSDRQRIYQGLADRATLKLPYFSILIVKICDK
jgi:precorrin-2/cobalt-factor-2 C20-methyltransferase